MKKILTMLAFLTMLPAGAALADDDCFVPMADWQPREAVVRLAAASGWTVRRIKIDDGCYEIDGHNAEGRRIEVKVHPGTLEVIELEFEDDDDRWRSERGHDDHDEECDDDDCPATVPSPAGTVTPPQNGLFGNGAPPQVKVN
jgi:hypothetical protein